MGYFLFSNENIYPCLYFFQSNILTTLSRGECSSCFHAIWSGKSFWLIATLPVVIFSIFLAHMVSEVEYENVCNSCFFIRIIACLHDISYKLWNCETFGMFNSSNSNLIYNSILTFMRKVLPFLLLKCIQMCKNGSTCIKLQT